MIYHPQMQPAYATRMQQWYATGICRREENRREQKTNGESFVLLREKLTFGNAHETAAK